MIPFNRSDIIKLIDHSATRWRHWQEEELQQFNNIGPVVAVDARSFRIRHQRSNDPNEMFPTPGLQAYVLVAETLWSRLKSNFLGRGNADEADFSAAIEAHIGNQKGWLGMTIAQPVADDVKSVVEQTDILRVYFVRLRTAGDNMVE